MRLFLCRSVKIHSLRRGGEKSRQLCYYIILGPKGSVGAQVEKITPAGSARLHEISRIKRLGLPRRPAYLFMRRICACLAEPCELFYAAQDYRSELFPRGILR